MAEQPRIVVIGGASLDIKGRLRRDFLPGTSNAAAVQISVGGVARNVAENLARLGVATALIAAVCADDFGQSILSQTEAAGVDISAMLLTTDERSAAYIAILGPDGALLAGLDDSQTARSITPAWIDQHAALLLAADMVVLDANVSRLTADHILDLCAAHGVPVALEPVAVGLADRYRERVGRFCLVTPNELEAEALSGMHVNDVPTAMAAAQHLVSQGTAIAVITLAQSGIVYATPDEVGHIPALAIEVVDPTGGGDALMAMMIYGLVNDIPVAECVRLGVVAAALTLRSPETVAPDLSLEHIYAQLAP